MPPAPAHLQIAGAVITVASVTVYMAYQYWLARQTAAAAPARPAAAGASAIQR